VRNSLRDATSVPCFVVSADAGQVVVQATGESRTFGCDTDLLSHHLDDGASAWGIEPPVEIDLEQQVLMIFLPVTASPREAGGEGSIRAVPIF
jgi:hypothetical protein